MAANQEGQEEESPKIAIDSAKTFMAIVMTLGLIFVPVGASAISRYNPITMRCSAIRAVVEAEGAVILKWRPPDNILRFDRYVAGNQYCDTEERIKATTVPSADQAECQVYVCRRYEPLDFFFLFGRDRTSRPRPH